MARRMDVEPAPAHIAALEPLEPRLLLSTTLISEGFEGAFPGLWATNVSQSRMWDDTSHRANTGLWSGHCAETDTGGQTNNYVNSMDTYMERTVDLSGYTSAELSFDYWMNTEAIFDPFRVKVDGSQVWSNSGSHQSWNHQALNLDSWVGDSSVTVRFEFHSDSIIVPSGDSGVWLDDILLTAEAATAWPPSSITPIGTWLELDPDGDDTYSASISPSGDNDVYTFVPDSSGTAHFYVNTPLSSLDPREALYNSSGNLIPGAYDDDGGPGVDSYFSYSVSAGARYYLMVDGFGGSAGSYDLVVDTQTPFHSAPSLDGNGDWDGPVTINWVGDQDYYRFTAPAGSTDLHLWTTGTLDTVLNLYGDAPIYNELERDDDGGSGVNADINRPITGGNTYYVRVAGFGSASGSTTFNVDFNVPLQQADLALTNFVVSRPADPAARTFTAASFDLVNHGPMPLVSEGVMVDYYLSSDTIFGNADDERIGDTGFNVSIAVGGTYPITLSSLGLTNMVDLWTSSLVPGGNYYVFADARLTNPPPTDPTSSNNRDRTNSTITYSPPVVDPNDQISEAATVAVGSSWSGSINPNTDVDMIRVNVSPGQRLGFDIDRGSSSSLDSYIRLFSSIGTELDSNDDGTGPSPEPSGLDSYLEYTFSSGGSYYLGISALSNTSYDAVTGDGDSGGYSTGSYTLYVYVQTGPDPGDGVVTHRALLVDAYDLEDNEDIYGMRDTLLSSASGEWLTGNIILIEYPDATLNNVETGISTFASACDQDDLALVYFTCHGDQMGWDDSPIDEPDGEDGNLVMEDGNLVDDTLGSWLSVFGAGLYPLDRFVLIVDACHSEEIMDGTADPAGTVSSHIIMSACQTYETAWGGIPYSEFTTYFIDALGSSATSADMNTNGYVSAEEAFHWADIHCVGQDPEISDTFTGELDLVSYINQPPTIASLSDNPDPVIQGNALTLTANGVSDDHGVALVSFYRDINGNNIGDPGELLGTDSNGADGWAWSGVVGWPAGPHTYLAQATDDGVPSPIMYSNWVSTVGMVPNQPPTIASVSDSPDPVIQANTLTVTATGVSDDHGVALVSFYRDINGNGVGDPGELLGTDSSAAGGWTWSGAASWAVGTHTYLARATDDGVPSPVMYSDWVSTVGHLVSAVTGDFTGEGHVDAADIDILCDNMGSLDQQYDLDDGTGTGTPDGQVDENDLTYLVEYLVEWDNGVDTGVGTKQGDFNLDGVVNATDLAIMKGTFGTSGVGYADGNANCDDVVNATDLAILKNNFGFESPGGGLSVSAAALLGESGTQAEPILASASVIHQLSPPAAIDEYAVDSHLPLSRGRHVGAESIEAGRPALLSLTANEPLYLQPVSRGRQTSSRLASPASATLAPVTPVPPLPKPKPWASGVPSLLLPVGLSAAPVPPPVRADLTAAALLKSGALSVADILGEVEPIF